jgi:hypothetical protein
MQATQRDAASRSGVPEHFSVQTAMGMNAQVPRSTGMCRSGAPQSGLAFFVKPRGFSLPHAHCAVDISIIQTATVN